MRLLLILCLTLSFYASAQIKVLKKEKTDSLFTSEIKKANGIGFPIYKTIEFKDKNGTHYFVATESRDSISGKDTLNKKLKVCMYTYHYRRTKAFMLQINKKTAFV